MQTGKFVAYLRVSTSRQGQSGLGLDAQREAVARYLQGGARTLAGEFVEVESGKGSNALARRPQLGLALETCRKHRATLVIAKLDRLARNVHFISGLLESGVEFVAADMPEANKVMLCFDHIVPFSRGGSNTVRNLQLLCESCNSSKGNRL